MTIRTRAQTFVRVLTRTWQIYRQHFVLFATLAGAHWLPVAGIYELGSHYLADTEVSTLTGMYWLAFAPQTARAAAVAAVSFYSDRPITFQQVLASSRHPLYFRPRKWGDSPSDRREKALRFGFAKTDALTMGSLLGLYMLFIAPCIYFGIYWMFVPAVTVIENRYMRDALKRSRELITGAWFEAFTIALLGAVIYLGLPTAGYYAFLTLAPTSAMHAAVVLYVISESFFVTLIGVYYCTRRTATATVDPLLVQLSKQLNQN